MRPVTITISGVSNSNPVPIDSYVSPSNLGMAVIVTGTTTYKVQYTY